MKNLPERMHPGIGAAAAVNAHRAAEDPLQPPFDDILHRAAVGLALPTAEAPAVVGADAFPALE